MPATRVNQRTRRRSSVIQPPTTAKPGTYRVPLKEENAGAQPSTNANANDENAHFPFPHPPSLSPLSNRPISFAPNVTPISYSAPDDDDDNLEDFLPPTSPHDLFPPSTDPNPAPSRRRVPPGKRRSQGYIPRPPNAFMLFRADFVRQKHVPGSIETNHGSLSKIIGNCWRALPIEQKKIWEHKAKLAKLEHKRMYPDYRFRPVHNKSKKAKAAAASSTSATTTGASNPTEEAAGERRCEEVAQLLLEGKKGDELARAVRHLDRMRGVGVGGEYSFYSQHQQQTSFLPHRRPSSVPLPMPSSDYPSHNANYFLTGISASGAGGEEGGIQLPQLPSLMNDFSMGGYYPRRPSSAFAILSNSTNANANSEFTIGRRASDPDAGSSFFTSPLFPTHTHTRSTSSSHRHLLSIDTEPLPDADESLFNPSFLANASGSFSSPHTSSTTTTSSLTSSAISTASSLISSPYDRTERMVAPDDVTGLWTNTQAQAQGGAYGYAAFQNVGPIHEYAAFPPTSTSTSTASSSAYSGSPEPGSPYEYHQHQQGQGQLGQQEMIPIVAPAPCTPTPGGWKGFSEQQAQVQPQQVYTSSTSLDNALGQGEYMEYAYDDAHTGAQGGNGGARRDEVQETFEALYAGGYGMGMGGMGMGMGEMGMDMSGMDGMGMGMSGMGY